MATGTTDRATGQDDAVLAGALDEMTSEGFDASAPIGSAPEDGSDDDAGNTDPAQSSATDNPPEDGEAGDQAAKAPADAQGSAATDANAEASQTDDTDPLAGSEPFTFTVDGQTRTMDGVFRIPGEGIIVPEAQVPRFQLMASRSEGLERQNRELYQKSQEYERLSSWKQRGPDGAEQTLTGRDGLIATRVELGRALATLNTVTSALRDPNTFASLVSVNEQGQIVPDATALKHLITQSELAEVNAEQAVRRHMQGIASQSTEPVAPNLAEVAPVLVQNLAASAGVKDLTPEDSKFLTGMIGRFIRPATQADVTANPALKLGESVVDPSFTDLITRHAGLRGETSKVAKATEKAATFNAGQQKGRAGTTRTAQPAKKPSASPAEPAAKVGRAERWDSVLHDALQDMAT